MNVLIIGNGAREHALVWKIKQSPLLGQLFVWPGNAAMFHIAASLSLPQTADFQKLLQQIRRQKIDLVIVGPEHFLNDGLADLLGEEGFAVFGPKKSAAQLEASKAFAKGLMQRTKIPTADFALAQDQSACHKLALARFNRDQAVVLKASGLAQGKGVFVCRSETEIHKALEMLYGKMFHASQCVVVEEFMQGRECSYFSFIGKGGATFVGFAVDYKRLLDQNQGPNTGGMGGYAPVSWLPQDADQLVRSLIEQPLLTELERLDINYVGCLYIGLMWTVDGPKVVEFNVRLGDPEAQVLAVHDQSDWLKIMAEKTGLLDSSNNKQRDNDKSAAVGVVMTTKDYPYGGEAVSSQVLPFELFDPEENKDTIVFAASVKQNDDKELIVGQGRVLTIVAKDKTFALARQRVYARVKGIAQRWSECHFRRDIASEVE